MLWDIGFLQVEWFLIILLVQEQLLTPLLL